MAAAGRAKTVAAATARCLCLPQCLAPPRSAPGAFELEHLVELETPPVRLQQEWAIVNCPIRKASGCGKHGQTVVEGLTLYARVLTSPGLSSALYIRFNDDALHAMKEEFGFAIDSPLIPIEAGRGFSAEAFVECKDESLIFFTLAIGMREHRERKYYLIYDSVAASLSMIPYLPFGCRIAYTLCPLKVPRGGGYEFAILACKPVPPTLERMERRKEDVICVWTPAATVEEEERPWRMLGRRFPLQSIKPLFAVDVKFSFGGQAFWVDLAQGLVHCDWPPAHGDAVVDVLCDWPPADGGAAVNFGFIGLPPGCPPDERYSKDRFEISDVFPMTRDRTMACVGGSIRFVCIDRSPRPIGSINISVWDLDPATKVWTNYKNFLAKELWRLWTFKTDGLPEIDLRFPTLMADGTLCLLLHDKPKKIGDCAVDVICNIELPILRVRWSGCLSKYHTCEDPVMLPFDFFKLLNPLIPRPRALRGIFTK